MMGRESRSLHGAEDQTYLERLVGKIEERNLPVEFMLHGHPAEGLVKAVAESGIDMLVHGLPRTARTGGSGPRAETVSGDGLKSDTSNGTMALSPRTISALDAEGNPCTAKIPPPHHSANTDGDDRPGTDFRSGFFH